MQIPSFRCPKPSIAQSLLISALSGLVLLGDSSARAQTFVPDLGLAPELMDGGRVTPPAIPPDCPELTYYPMPAEQTQGLLNELPGRPLLPTTKTPMAHRWWKYPIYAVVGFPRDLVDSVFGVLSYVPVVNIADYAVYELVPVQALMRDPRDWHRWDGNRNRNGHGFYDGNRWGFFSTLRHSDLRYPSGSKEREIDAYNDGLREELRLLNRQIEQRNRQIEARKLEARSAALRAIQDGKGVEAVCRMVPYFEAHPLDGEGALALLATGLALNGFDVPEWYGPLLWSRLTGAQPEPLQRAANLLQTTLEQQPDQPLLHEALIYTALLQGDESAALERARKYSNRDEGNQRRMRLLMEVALTARSEADLERLREGLHSSLYPDWEWRVLEARIDLLAGRLEPARRELADLQASTPENPYLNYFLGCAELLLARTAVEPLKEYESAFGHLELAALQAAHPALRQRAGQALAFARSVSAQMGAHPELFAPAEAASPDRP